MNYVLFKISLANKGEKPLEAMRYYNGWHYKARNLALKYGGYIDIDNSQNEISENTTSTCSILLPSSMRKEDLVKKPDPHTLYLDYKSYGVYKQNLLFEEVNPKKLLDKKKRK